jgi:hypothetical protein
MKYITIILLAFLIASCNPCRYVARHQECFPPDSVNQTSTQTVIDHSDNSAPDSSLFDALFLCDSANRALMKEVHELKSNGVTTTVSFQDNHLTIKTKTDSLRYRTRTVTNTVIKEVVKINPVNAELKRQNEKYEKKIQRKNVWLKITGGSLAVLIILIALYIWFKLK